MKDKMVYEKPRMTGLNAYSTITQGACTPGSGDLGNCLKGASATSGCGLGSTAGSVCSTGKSAAAGCSNGVGR